MKMLSGPILADMAANVLAMTMVVLIVLGRLTMQAPAPPPPVALTAYPVAPIGGAAAVELLRQRLLPASAGLADAVQNGSLPLGPVRVLFVLDPAAYVEVSARLADREDQWQELTVPQALKTADNTWHPDFLALAGVAADPDRFRSALQDLLARRSLAGSGTSPLTEGATPQTHFARWFVTALDLMGLTALLAALWGLSRLRRWALTA